ncbi:competence protein ComJ [Stenotrophomonas sp. BIGb0135]|uniref:competence protein ComJ n=1 Tax=Stenotrophomonas sp. BIGb0135 TaxID=2940620 RepID=UPI00216A218D|nr:competence protein ComJ [Stenotrophomonas sp. BIGb0135]MCS4233060.1 hypothetical protein [Stenotrophomonas sp. BIGb0135]
MSIVEMNIHISYAQLCVFSSNLDHPFNQWSERHVSQGFSWRDCSVSFRTLLEEGRCVVRAYVDEPIPSLGVDVVRAFKVPFVTTDGHIEIGSVIDTVPLQLAPGDYVLQVELLWASPDIQQANVRLNKGAGQLDILRADGSIERDGALDAVAVAAL